jgi:sugar-specific transcriptional regulator TrmB
MRLESTLAQFGLTEREAHVYLSLLTLGSSRITPIAKHAGVPRNTVYSVLDRLTALELVIPMTEGNVIQYVAEDPKQFLDQARERLTAARDIFPSLEALYRQTRVKPEVRHYKGLGDIKQIYEGILKEKDLKQYCILSSESTWMKMDRRFFSAFLKRRAAKRIFTKLILEESPEAREHQRRQQEWFGEVKILPPGFEKQYVGGVYLFPHRVVFIAQQKEFMAVAIQSQEIRDTLQLMFDLLWRML